MEKCQKGVLPLTSHHGYNGCKLTENVHGVPNILKRQNVKVLLFSNLLIKLQDNKHLISSTNGVHCFIFFLSLEHQITYFFCSVLLTR